MWHVSIELSQPLLHFLKSTQYLCLSVYLGFFVLTIFMLWKSISVVLMSEWSNSPRQGLSTGLECLICSCTSRDTAALWQHIISVHVNIGSFPDVSFLENDHRHLCSDCGFLLQQCWSSCHPSLESGHSLCNRLMEYPCG